MKTEDVKIGGKYITYENWRDDCHPVLVTVLRPMYEDAASFYVTGKDFNRQDRFRTNFSLYLSFEDYKGDLIHDTALILSFAKQCEESDVKDQS